MVIVVLSFMLAANSLVGKVLFAMYYLFVITRGLAILVEIMSDLFDKYVVSVINYSCEIWRFLKAENIKRIHSKFCECILGVKIQFQ